MIQFFSEYCDMNISDSNACGRVYGRGGVGVCVLSNKYRKRLIWFEYAFY